MINMEVKKHALQQLQDGSWKLTLNVHPNDMPVELMQAPMGTPYGLAMTQIDYDNSVVREIGTTEKTEGERAVTSAAMLCKDERFWEFLNDRGYGKVNSESDSKLALYKQVEVESLSKLKSNEGKRAVFYALVDEFNTWRFEQDYADNLSRC